MPDLPLLVQPFVRSVEVARPDPSAIGFAHSVKTLAAGLPRLVLADRDGHRLEGARVVGQAIRPLGNSAPIDLAFRAVAPGEYLAETRLVAAGQWEIDLTAAISGKRIHLAQRVVVP